MIDLYTYSSFNGRRVSIMLEETGLEYKAHKIDLMKGEQQTPEYLKLNPSGRIPCIVENQSATGEALILTQSAAILLYLAEKSGQFLPDEAVSRAHALEWLCFHVTDIGPNLFSAFYLKSLIKPAHPEAALALQERTFNLYQYFDQRLEENEYLAGECYSIADIAMLPTLATVDDVRYKEYLNIQRWLNQLMQRPAVQKGLAVPA